MYKLSYCFIFKLIEKRNPDTQFGAASFVWLMQFVHIAFILALIKKIFKVTYPALSETYFLNKLYFAPIAIIWLVLFYRYIRKRSDAILNDHRGKDIVTLKNAFIVFSSLLIPLILMIQLLQK